MILRGERTDPPGHSRSACKGTAVDRAGTLRNLAAARTEVFSRCEGARLRRHRQSHKRLSRPARPGAALSVRRRGFPHVSGCPQQPRPADLPRFRRRGQDVMRDRGINRSVWRDALQVMSEDDAMMCARTDAPLSKRAAIETGPLGEIRQQRAKDCPAARRDEAKCGANYAAGLAAQAEAECEGCDQAGLPRRRRASLG